MNSKILLVFMCLVFVSLVASTVMAVSDRDVRDLLKRAIFDYANNGTNDTIMPLVGVKSLLTFYLTTPKDAIDVQIYNRTFNNTRVADVFFAAQEKIAVRDLQFQQKQTNVGNESGNLSCIAGPVCMGAFYLANRSESCQYSDPQPCEFGCVNGDCQGMPHRLSDNTSFQPENDSWNHNETDNRSGNWSELMHEWRGRMDGWRNLSMNWTNETPRWSDDYTTWRNQIGDWMNTTLNWTGSNASEWKQELEQMRLTLEDWKSNWTSRHNDSDYQRNESDKRNPPPMGLINDTNDTDNPRRNPPPMGLINNTNDTH